MINFFANLLDINPAFGAGRLAGMIYYKIGAAGTPAGTYRRLLLKSNLSD